MALSKFTKEIRTKFDYFRLAKFSVAALVALQSSAAIAQSNDKGLVGLVRRFTTLGNEAKTLVEVVFFVFGLAIAGYGLAKFFGVMDSRPGESKMKFIMATIGGGALIGLGAVVEMSKVTIVNS